MYVKKSLSRPVMAVLLIIFLSVLTGPTTAQTSDEDTWRYGYRLPPSDAPDEALEDSYDLVAYNLSGEVETVIEGLIDPPILLDLGDSHVLASVEHAEGDVLYDINGTEATPIDMGAGDSDDFYASVLISYRAPYALLSSGRIGDPLIAIDLENHTAQITDQGGLYALTNCCVLTDQGTVQYYARVASDDGRQEALIERDLKTGEERFLFDGENLNTGYTNQSGDQWLLFLYHPDTRERTTIVWQDGEEISRTTAPLAIRIMWIGDAILTNDALCERNCEFTLQTRDGETSTFSVTYPDAGEGSDRTYFPNRFSPDGGLLGHLSGPDQIVKLNTDGSFEVFGDFNAVSLATNGAGMISNDGRFAAVIPDPDAGGFAVIDTETGEAVIRSDPENVPNFANVFFFPEGVMATSYSGRETTVFYYRISDQQLFEHALRNIQFVDVVDDETMLYLERSEEVRSPVIGLYTLDDGERQPVVEGVFPVFERPAIR